VWKSQVGDPAGGPGVLLARAASREAGSKAKSGAGSSAASMAVRYFLKQAPPQAGMAELADAADSKSADRKVVGVRPPLPAPIKFTNKSNKMSEMDAIRGLCGVSLISDIE
jgi:hypothetical protein